MAKRGGGEKRGKAGAEAERSSSRRSSGGGGRSRKQRPAAGRPAPLGAHRCNGGVNFSLYSRHATGVELLLFDGVDDAKPARVIEFDPVQNRTYHYWHVYVRGVSAGQIYGYRVYGPDDPSRGLRFDPQKVLLDPYGLAVAVPDGYDRAAGCRPGDNASHAMKSVVVDPSLYDWEGDQPIRNPITRTVVYELHVRGFTRHPSSGVAEEKRGTFAGLIEKIPYLQQLGVTAVELLPVFQYDPFDAPNGKMNYWGYAPISFFAPHHAYSSRRDPLGAIDEFRDMVKALHRAGIEVILDVVYNHTCEGNEFGPTMAYRGIDNPTYYILEQDPARYANYSGTGNTVNANHPVARRMIVDSLRHWVDCLHVDGFRFDLASILARDQRGAPMSNPPVLWDIETDPRLAGLKIMAEAWDAAGLYQVGSFVGDSWREWNGRFRDDVRSFVRGDPGASRRVADRILGSPQLYGHENREAEQSVNFVSCHDGFTLNDLVSYNEKHNEANGEGNRDGANDDRSWNCGVEGPTDDAAVEALRNRQVKNFFTFTLLSLGVPMFQMGDEVRRTQCGNNNAYCQDNEISWFDWGLVERHADLLRFVRLLIERRVQRSLTAEDERLTLQELLCRSTVHWHGVELNMPDWGDASRTLAVTVRNDQFGVLLHLIFNAYWEALEFALPRNGEGLEWRRWIDTSLASPQDITPWDEAPSIEDHHYRAGPRSVAVLYSPIPVSEGAEQEC